MNAIEPKPWPDDPVDGAEFSPTKAMGVWMQAVAPYGILMTDKNLCIKSWNDWLVGHSGRSAQQVVGRRLTDVYPDLETRRFGGHYSRALAGEIVVLSTALHRYLLPFPATVARGDVPHMLQTVRIAPLSEDGVVVGTITVIEDVTQREIQAGILQRQQEVDRLLSSALAILLQSEDPSGEMAGIFSTICPVLALDTYLGYLLEPNGRSLRLHVAGGISPKLREAIGTLALTEEAQSAWRGGWNPAELDIAGHVGALRNFGIGAQCTFPLVVGERTMGLVVFATYRPATIGAADLSILSRIARYVAIALDRAWREREILAASRAKDDFLAALSHELRTPLNPVLLIASDACTNPGYSPEVREAFRVVEKNVQMEARMIDDLLDITRIEHGKFALELKPVDLHALLRDALETVQADLAEKRLTVHVDFGGKASTVAGDAGRLRQVFWNVLKNAVKFTPIGGEIWVATESDPAAKQIIVKVTDTGIGMDEKELGRVFGAFAQGDHAGGGRSHRFGGLGLGLAISRKLVEAHDGVIEAASAGLNQGATLTIRVPLAIGERAALPAPAKGENAPLHVPPPQVGVRPQKGRILLVEDHEPSLYVLRRLLERRGFAVTPVLSATAALAAASVAAFDLVISDIGLPDGDGFGLMKTLRDDHRAIGIAVTGYGTEADMARTNEAGFFAHLTKPVTAAALDRALSVVFPAVQPVGSAG